MPLRLSLHSKQEDDEKMTVNCHHGDLSTSSYQDMSWSPAKECLGNVVDLIESLPPRAQHDRSPDCGSDAVRVMTKRYKFICFFIYSIMI